MVDYKKSAMAAVGVTVISYGLGWVYSKYFADGIATLTFSAVDVNIASQVKSGIDTSLAGKLLSYLGGVIPVGGTMNALLTLFVASFLVVVLASFIADKITVGKTETTRFGVSMAIAAGVIGLIVGSISPSVGSLGTGIAMLIYFSIIALIYSALSNVDGLKDFVPQP